MGDVLLPILRDTRDPHYRYKMPKLMAKVEGSGNGIKTVIVNMVAIAKALGRPPTYPTKYFGCELGAQVTMDHDQYIVNGAHDADKLLNLLYTFIRKFVLCTKCNNPETTLTVANQTIRSRCAACGNDFTISKTMHKLTTFIINHPPDSSTSAATVASSSTSSSSQAPAAATKSSKSSKSSKGKGKNGHSPTNGQSADGNNNENGGSSTNGHNGHAKTANGDFQDDDFNDDFDDDALTAEAYAERMRGLCDGVNGAMYLNDQKESANFFYKCVSDRKEAGQLQDPAVQKELLQEAVRLEIKDKASLVLSELLFTENIFDEIKTYRMVLLRFCHENKKAQKYLLGGFEKLVGDIYKDSLFNNTAKILKQFYDEDILEEEVIIEWAAKDSKKYVSKDMSKKIHEKAAPFIKWLKEAEVEDDDSDEEDEQPAAKPNGKSPSPETTNGTNGKTNGNGNGVHANNGKNGQKQQVVASYDDDEEDDDLDFEFSHRVSGIQLVDVVNKDTASLTCKQAVAAAAAASGSAAAEKVEDDFDIDNI